MAKIHNSFVLSQQTHSMKQLFPLFFLLFICFFSSCGEKDPIDDDDKKPEFTSKEMMLHNGDKRYWILTKEIIAGTDVTSGIDNCQLDNIYIFDKYGNYNIDAGATKCPNNPEDDVIIGFYTLDEANNKLTLGNNDTTIVCDILLLETSKLRWKAEINHEIIERTFVPK